MVVNEDDRPYEPAVMCGEWYVATVLPHAGDGNTEANARLIAAAPDLLRTLQFIADADPAEWDEEVRDQFQAWAQARARIAIAKATQP